MQGQNWCCWPWAPCFLSIRRNSRKKKRWDNIGKAMLRSLRQTCWWYECSGEQWLSWDRLLNRFFSPALSSIESESVYYTLALLSSPRFTAERQGQMLYQQFTCHRIFCFWFLCVTCGCASCNQWLAFPNKKTEHPGLITNFTYM